MYGTGQNSLPVLKTLPFRVRHRAKQPPRTQNPAISCTAPGQTASPYSKPRHFVYGTGQNSLPVLKTLPFRVRHRAKQPPRTQNPAISCTAPGQTASPYSKPRHFVYGTGQNSLPVLKTLPFRVRHRVKQPPRTQNPAISCTAPGQKKWQTGCKRAPNAPRSASSAFLVGASAPTPTKPCRGRNKNGPGCSYPCMRL